MALIAADQYPTPPARYEYLVTDGKPTGLVSTFIEWILTDGQAFVAEAGYVNLTESQIADSLSQLK